jgi:hypothetical protein
MSNDPESVSATRAASSKLEVAHVKQLLIATALAVVLTGCGLPAGRDVRAYDVCMSRHPQEMALCEGPRQAYEVDTSTYQAKATAISPPASSSYAERSAASHPALTPVPLGPNLTPITSGPSG